jgi:hypothetical protein
VLTGGWNIRLLDPFDGIQVGFEIIQLREGFFVVVHLIQIGTGVLAVQSQGDVLGRTAGVAGDEAAIGVRAVRGAFLVNVGLFQLHVQQLHIGHIDLLQGVHQIALQEPVAVQLRQPVEPALAVRNPP